MLDSQRACSHSGKEKDMWCWKRMLTCVAVFPTWIYRIPCMTAQSRFRICMAEWQRNPEDVMVQDHCLSSTQAFISKLRICTLIYTAPVTFCAISMFPWVLHTSKHAYANVLLYPRELKPVSCQQAFPIKTHSWKKAVQHLAVFNWMDFVLF